VCTPLKTLKTTCSVRLTAATPKGLELLVIMWRSPYAHLPGSVLAASISRAVLSMSVSFIGHVLMIGMTRWHHLPFDKSPQLGVCFVVVTVLSQPCGGKALLETETLGTHLLVGRSPP
jgi:hypothetical protein